MNTSPTEIVAASSSRHSRTKACCGRRWWDNLYQFWGNRPAWQLASETGFVLNLASKEYSKAVEPHLPESIRFLTCNFGEWKNGKVVEKGTQCKKASCCGSRCGSTPEPSNP